jgi:hypothetical protein
MTRNLIAAICALCFAAAVAAHGVPKPKHGGWVDTGTETSFELVRQGQRVLVYIEDHGKPVNTDRAHGEILVGSETGKVLARLKAAGANTLQGPAIPASRGQRLFVRVTFGNGSTEVGEIVVP